MDPGKNDSPGYLDKTRLGDPVVEPPPKAETITGGLVGKLLDGRYLVEKELGAGGIGAVFIARDLKVLGRSVVVKILLEESYKNEYVVKKFRQEVEALSRVNHPNIVGILDTGEMGDGKPYLVMQYIDGVSLRSVMRPEGIELERAAQIMKQTGRALSAAHDKGILHRDLKPENIMLEHLGSGDEEVKVIDFGIAKIKDSVVAPETMVLATAGTIAYMSPEQLSAGSISAASDIYALGVIAFEILTGRKPYNPESPFQLLEMQRSGVKLMPRDLRPGISEAAQQVILRALSFDPAQRQPRARDFGDNLSQALLEGTVATPTSSLSPAPAMDLRTVSAQAPTTNQQQVISTSPLSAADASQSLPAMPPVQPAVPSYTQAAPPPKRSILPWILGGLGALAVVGMIAGLVVWLVILPGKPVITHPLTPNSNTAAPTPSNTGASPAPVTAAANTVRYSLTVQKFRAGKPYDPPFESTGRDIFENGWGFRLNVTSEKGGYFYLLNYGPGPSGSNVFGLFFPNAAINGGSAKLSDNQVTHLPNESWYHMDVNKGTENFYMVWSAQPVPELEAAGNWVDPKTLLITDQAHIDAIKAFLDKQPKPDVEKDKDTKQMIVKGSNDILVNLVELEHH